LILASSQRALSCSKGSASSVSINPSSEAKLGFFIGINAAIEQLPQSQPNWQLTRKG
jgi:hypothetical protein